MINNIVTEDVVVKVMQHIQVKVMQHIQEIIMSIKSSLQLRSTSLFSANVLQPTSYQ
jgi:hypothetical protein